MISIQEIEAFNQVITAVLDGKTILDLRKGTVTDHQKQAARYHAKKQRQTMILVKPVNDHRYHITTENQPA